MLIAVGRVNRRRPLARERERHCEERACRPVRGADKTPEPSGLQPPKCEWAQSLKVKSTLVQNCRENIRGNRGGRDRRDDNRAANKTLSHVASTIFERRSRTVPRRMCILFLFFTTKREKEDPLINHPRSRILPVQSLGIFVDRIKIIFKVYRRFCCRWKKILLATFL